MQDLKELEWKYISRMWELRKDKGYLDSDCYFEEHWQVRAG